MQGPEDGQRGYLDVEALAGELGVPGSVFAFLSAHWEGAVVWIPVCIHVSTVPGPPDKLPVRATHNDLGREALSCHIEQVQVLQGPAEAGSSASREFVVGVSDRRPPKLLGERQGLLAEAVRGYLHRRSRRKG